mgnify:CR=1 FL=1
MAVYRIAFDITKKYEGGYQAWEDDNGNWTGGKKGKGILIGTNRGVTAYEYAAYLGKTPTIQEMKDMPANVPFEIFKKKYWDVMKGDAIINQEVANHIFDMCINAGNSIGIKLAQRVLGLNETGVMNNETLIELNKL